MCYVIIQNNLEEIKWLLDRDWKKGVNVPWLVLHTDKDVLGKKLAILTQQGHLRSPASSEGASCSLLKPRDNPWPINVETISGLGRPIAGVLGFVFSRLPLIEAVSQR